MAVEESTYTFANVQNLVLGQGSLERLLGLAHLQLDTAGGGTTNSEPRERQHHQGRLEGLELEQASALRDHILDAVSRYADTGLGDHLPRISAPQRGSRTDRAELEAFRAIAAELRRINAELQKPDGAAGKPTAP